MLYKYFMHIIRYGMYPRRNIEIESPEIKNKIK